MAGASELDEPAMVHDAVDDRGSQLVVGEHRAPPAELDIGGEYDAPPLAALGDHLAEQPCAVHIEGDVAEPVQDEEPCPGDIREQPAGRPLALGLPQLEHQLRGLEEPHGIACRGRRDAERRGHVGLALM